MCNVYNVYPIKYKLYYILLHIDVQYYDLSLNMIKYLKNCISTECNKQCFSELILLIVIIVQQRHFNNYNVYL